MTRCQGVRAVSLAGLVLAGLVSQQALADEKKSLRPEIGKFLKEADDLEKAKKFGPAMAQIQQAEAVSNRTAYENYVIDVLKEKAELGTNDYSGAARTAESLLGSAELSADQRPVQISVMIAAYQTAKDYPKLIDAINRYYKEGGTDPRYHGLITQSYYLAGDYANAAKMARAAIQETERAGGKPSEDDLKLLLGSEYKVSQSGPGYIDALERLIKYYPNKDYWHDLFIAVQHKSGYTEKLDLDLQELRITTGVATTADDYTQTAEGAMEIGLPGVAKTLLDKGYAAGVLGQGAEASRQKRLSDLVNKTAADDVKTLGANAAAAKDGTALYKLADAYASYGQYDKAMEFYQKAIAAGSFKTPLDGNLAKLHYGVALLNAGQKAKAKDALTAVTGADGTSDLAQMWLLEAGLR